MVGGLPMVIPVGDKKFSSGLCETIDKLILSIGQNVHRILWKTIDSDAF